MTRRRLAVIAVATAIAAGAPVALAAGPSAPVGAKRTWACVDQEQMKMGVCVSDPIPWVGSGS